jgi:hypothetical protein
LTPRKDFRRVKLERNGLDLSLEEECPVARNIITTEKGLNIKSLFWCGEYRKSGHKTGLVFP